MSCQIRTLSVVIATLAVGPAAQAQAKPAPAAAPAAAGEQTVVLDAFSVQSDVYNGYTATKSSTGTRIAADIKGIPFSVEVVPLEIWNDFALLTFNQQETMALAPGVTSSDNNGNFNIRGISSGSYFLRDGFLRFGRMDQSNIERIEVIKGPAAAIYGKTLPGGILNAIPKLPKSTPEYSLELQGGSLDLYRASVGATGPLISEKLRYRVDLSNSHEKAFEELRSNSLKSLSGQLAWDLTPNTHATLEYDYVDEFRGGKDGLDEAVVKIGGVFQGLAWNFPNYRHNLNTSGGVTYSTFKSGDVNFSAVSKLNEIFSLRLGGHYHRYRLVTLRGTGSWDPTTNLVWNRRPDFTMTSNNGHAMNLDLLGKFSLAGMEHNLLSTLDFVRDQREIGPSWRLTPSLYTVATGYPGAQLLKEFSASGQDPWPYPPIKDFTSLFRDQNSVNTTAGILLNDRVTLLKDRLIVSLGGRHDRVHQLATDAVTRTRSDTNVSATTVQTGLNYSVTPDATFYGSYSTSFSPQTQLDPSGNPFPNQEGKGYEGGVKTDLFRKQLFVTASYFNIVYDNIVQQGTDPLSNTTIYTLSGAIKSKGYELGVGGKLWRALTVKVALSYTDAVQSGNLGASAVLNGTTPRGVPNWAYGSLFKYDFSAGRLKGFSVGSNVTTQSDYRYSDSPTGGRYRVRVPGWARYDFNLSYSWKTANRRLGHSAGVVVKNAFNREYAYGNGASPGNPRQWILRYSLLFR